MSLVLITWVVSNCDLVVAEPNECEELFEIDNGADEQELKQLEAGDFDGLLCAAVLTGVLVKYATNPGWSGKLGRRDEDGGMGIVRFLIANRLVFANDIFYS